MRLFQHIGESRSLLLRRLPTCGGAKSTVRRSAALIGFAGLALVLTLSSAGCDRSSAADPASGNLTASKPKAKHKKTLILGCDGMDPKLVRRLIDEGRLPHFAKLEQQGGFKPLTTSIPPQSPVAWSNFITGANPGVHGIYDFIQRDLDAKREGANVRARQSTTIDIPAAEPLFEFPLNDYRFTSADLNPFAVGVQPVLTRAGVPFWDYLDERGIPIQMYKLAANYPPSESKHGHMCCLAGMGVPDALGTLGTFQHFSTEYSTKQDVKGGRHDRIRMDLQNGGYVIYLKGPPNSYKPVSRRTGLPPELEVSVYVYPDPDRPCAKLVWTNEGVAADQTVEIVLNVGEWSEWKEIHFLHTPAGPVLTTMVRFYLQKLKPDPESPEIAVFVTPLNFVPTSPAAVISEPAGFVSEIGEAVGHFHTQGFAEQFNARYENDLSDAEYKAQADLILEENFALMDYALKRYVDGVLFFYFSSTDLQAHIFWWDSEHPHPFRSAADAARYMGVIERVYERMDEALAKCMDALGDDATYIVMSDHGFGNFRRQFGLNTWLRNEGYLVSEKGVLEGERDASGNWKSSTRWNRTKAYGLGLNGIYLNIAGREREGIVRPEDRVALCEEIKARLLAVVDPENPSVHPIRYVYRREECYSGDKLADAPDLIIGYEKDYRCSWQTGLGHFDREVVFDNKEAWSADHCVAHDLVPGILLSNRKITKDDPALIDVAPSILAEYGIETPESMEGRPMLGPGGGGG